jgi:hypothetical protein
VVLKRSWESAPPFGLSGRDVPTIVVHEVLRIIPAKRVSVLQHSPKPFDDQVALIRLTFLIGTVGKQLSSPQALDRIRLGSRIGRMKEPCVYSPRDRLGDAVPRQGPAKTEADLEDSGFIFYK